MTSSNVFQFIRVEDIAYDRHDKNVVYIADSGRGADQRPAATPATSTNGRIFKLVLDPKRSDQGKSLSILIDGDDNPAGALGEIHQPDNVETSKNLLLDHRGPGQQQQFPVGSTDRRHDRAAAGATASGQRDLAVVAKVDQSADEGPTDRDAATARARLGAWESSGIVDASKHLGKGTFLIDVQARHARRRGGAARAADLPPRRRAAASAARARRRRRRRPRATASRRTTAASTATSGMAGT